MGSDGPRLMGPAAGGPLATRPGPAETWVAGGKFRVITGSASGHGVHRSLKGMDTRDRLRYYVRPTKGGPGRVGK